MPSRAAGLRRRTPTRGARPDGRPRAVRRPSSRRRTRARRAPDTTCSCRAATATAPAPRRRRPRVARRDGRALGRPEQELGPRPGGRLAREAAIARAERRGLIAALEALLGCPEPEHRSAGAPVAAL